MKIQMELKLTILYDQQQIYLHLLLQDHNTSIQISKHLNILIMIFHDLLFNWDFSYKSLALEALYLYQFLKATGHMSILTLAL